MLNNFCRKKKSTKFLQKAINRKKKLKKIEISAKQLDKAELEQKMKNAGKINLRIFLLILILEFEDIEENNSFLLRTKMAEKSE